jgi:hypothetical protein
MKLLTRWGMPVEEVGKTCLIEPDAAGEGTRTLRPLQAATLWRDGTTHLVMSMREVMQRLTVLMPQVLPAQT